MYTHGVHLESNNKHVHDAKGRAKKAYFKPPPKASSNETIMDSKAIITTTHLLPKSSMSAMSE
jgi:hypothetical protein